MRTIAQLLFMLIWVTGAAQTNTTDVLPEPTTLVRPTLWPETERGKPAESISDSSNRVQLKLDLPLPKQDWPMLDDYPAPTFDDTTTATTVESEQALMLLFSARLKEAGYMNPKPPPPEDFFSRTVNALFQPEPVRVGRASVAFSPITAIKRKNPLALLNPLVLNVLW